MSYKITFLNGSKGPIRKYFSGTQDNENTLYQVSNFTSIHKPWNTLKDLNTLCIDQAKTGAVLLCGELDTPISSESRAGHSTDEPTSHIVIDADDLPLPPEALLSRLKPLTHAGHILHWSSSEGLKKNNKLVEEGFRYHLILQTLHPLTAQQRDCFFKHLCMTYLPDLIKLNEKVEGSLIWPLDMSLAESSKMVTLQEPILEPPFTSELKKEDRFRLHEGPAVDVDMELIETSAILDAQHQLMNTMRQARGLPKLAKNQITYKKGAINLAKNLVPSPLTFLNESNGFAHYDLGDGNRGSYYHPIDNPKIIYSFKPDALPFMHKDMDPDSFAQAMERMGTNIMEPEDDTGVLRLYCMNPEEGQTASIVFDKDNGTLIYKSKIDRAAMQDLVDNGTYKCPEPKLNFVPEFNMQRPAGLYEAEGNNYPTANTFIEPILTRNKIRAEAPNYHIDNVLDAITEKCPHLAHMLRHSAGYNDYFTNVELNFLHGIVVKRIKPTIALMKHGTGGIGKDILADQIYRPLLGFKYVRETQMEELAASWNEWEDQTRLIFVPETTLQRKQVNYSTIANNIKMMITSEHRNIKQKFKDSVPIIAHYGMMFFSNEVASLDLKEENRRLVIATYQRDKLTDINGIDPRLRSELHPLLHAEQPILTDILYDYKLNEELYFDAPETAEKLAFKDANRTAFDSFIAHFVDGDLDAMLPNAEIDNQELFDRVLTTSFSTLRILSGLASHIGETVYISAEITLNLAVLITGTPLTLQSITKAIGRRHINPESNIHCVIHNKMQTLGYKITPKMSRAGIRTLAEHCKEVGIESPKYMKKVISL